MTNKATNLAQLTRHGVRTPQTFVVPAEVYRRVIAGREAQLLRAAATPGGAEEFFLDAPISPDDLSLIARGIDSLHGVQRYAVRSSGTVSGDGGDVEEDGYEQSLAGQFDTMLQVPRDRLELALRKCWASLFNDRSIETFGLGERYVAHSDMTVVIQEMIPAQASAVMMTADPLGDGTTGSFDATLGPCQALVEGIVCPDEVTFVRRTMEITSVTVGSKTSTVVHDDYNGFSNSRLVKTCPTDAARPSMSDDLLRRIVELGCRIERLFAYPQDVELVVDHADRIVITQARPVTCLTTNPSPLPTRER